MNKKIHQFVLSVALFCFVSVATGIADGLHHLCQDHHEEHNSEHCLVCEQLATVNRNCLYQQDYYIINNFPVIEIIGSLYESIDLNNSYIELFSPRPPPVFC